MGAYDISRISFDPSKHYSSVRLQQGRVLTDADQVEDESIDAEEQRRTQLDIIGGYGSPDSGFYIGNPVINPMGLLDFTIEKGNIYLGGIRFELDKQEKFLTQDDWLYREDAAIKPPVLLPGQEQFDLVYLEAWQQYVTAVEDNSLLEVALGGPDTTTRIRNMRRVKIFNDSGSEECAVSWCKARNGWIDGQLGKVDASYERKTSILLTVGFEPGDTENLCSPTVVGGYLGAENQAIRVQITKKNFFTWGFDNASPLYRVNITTGTTLATLQTEPKDQFHWPVTGQVVEILPWSAVLPNGEIIAEEVGFLTSVTAPYDPDLGTFSIKDPLTLPQLPGQMFFYMRVWNRGNDLGSDPEIKFNPGTPVSLGKTGINVNFTSSDAGNPVPDMVRGDFWIIAARPETPDKVYPWELKTGMHSFGVRRFFAPLAVLKWTTDANNKVSPEIIHDCRRPFHPLSQQDCCCTYSVGDGLFSKGDFNSIQEAVDHLPAEGGKICVLAGIHNAHVIIKNRQKIHISGCGLHTIVRANIDDRKNRLNPVFTIMNSNWIVLENMVIVAMEGIGVLVKDDMQLGPSEEISVRHNYIHALIHAVRIEARNNLAEDNHIQVVYNRIGMINEEKGDVAIFSLANDVLIERNKILVIPGKPGGEEPPGGNEPPGGGEDPCDCDKIKIIYRQYARFRLYVGLVLRHFAISSLMADFRVGYLAKGGIQIGCSSERVLILMNEIFGGAGHGIILGHGIKREENPNMLSHADASVSFAPLGQIAIEENKIFGMELSGISAFTLLQKETAISLIYVTDLTIYKNHITKCAVKIPEQTFNSIYSIGFGGICLAICEDTIIRENRIEHNGQSQIQPVCGIFMLMADVVDISNNRILENGRRVLADDRLSQAGYRAGILIRMMTKTVKLANYEKLKSINIQGYDATPAVKIHDNSVSQPMGHALWMSGGGEVSIVSNQFTSHGVDPRNKTSTIAATIYLLNLGLSNGMIAGAVYKSAQRGLIPPGKILFTANQVTLDLRSKDIGLCLSSVLMASRDDIAFNDNQVEAVALQPGGDKVIVDTFLFTSTTVRANENLFMEGEDLSLFSLYSYGYINTTTCNQAAHCILVVGTKMEVDRDNLIIFPDSCKVIGERIVNFYHKN